VTLRSENIIDPSGVVIPKANYVWWMKGSSGKEVVIGNGPSMSYKFTDEKNYIVYLSVSSASKNRNGYTDVLPFNSSTVIDVQGKVANVRIYMNGLDLSYDDTYKVHPSDARAGIIIDATPSFAADGYQFVYTTWDFGNGNTSSYNGAPKLERQIYSNEGTYTLHLKVTNNEGKQMEKLLTIIVRDPIASIVRDKDEGYVGDDFHFSPGAYFQKSDKISYGWEVLDLETGKGIYESALQNITYKFLKVGTYAIRLTTTAPNGERDIESIKISIESRNPISVYESKMVSAETPNTFYFDGSRSYDPDTYENSALDFKWFIDGKEAILNSPTQNGSMGYYTFSTLGNHKVALEVTNSDLKKGTFNRDITVSSLLSVKLRIPTKISYVGKSVNFLVDSPDANTYEWVFGDGETDVGNQSKINHTYKKSGTFDVSLTVRGKSGVDSNTITRKVFIKGGDDPMAYISVKNGSDDLIPIQDACDGREAYIVDRSKAITFGATDSINTDGSTSGLSYAWKFGERVSSQQSFSYQFDELGCFPIVLTVRSKKTGKTNTQQVYARVDNLPPKISGLMVTPENMDKDPVIVTVSANNAADPDGVIVSYLWYYYTEGNPEPQDVRITKSPRTTFVLSRVSNKYYFVLIAEDSNGDKTNTDEFFQEKYSLQILSDNTNTPLITLKPDKRAAGVGEDIKFVATVKNVLGNDITNKVEYKWDFDGDGFYDKTSSEATADYQYDKPGEYHVKLKANYKGISNTHSETVIITNVLSPDFATIGVGEKIAFVNTSKGTYKKVTWKLGSKTISEKLDSFTYDFSQAGLPQDVTLQISDGSDTKSVTLPVKKDIVNIKQIAKKTDALVYLTYPRAHDDTVHVETSSDRLFVYLGESKGSGSINAYSIDTDTEIDSDLNGGTDDDSDNRGTDSYTR